VWQDDWIGSDQPELRLAGEGETRRLPLETLAEFDFRTVPAEWEQFFDDLVCVRFETDDGKLTVTIGTETAVADRFVTVLLKLLLDDTTAEVRQRLYALDGEGESRAPIGTDTGGVVPVLGLSLATSSTVGR